MAKSNQPYLPRPERIRHGNQYYPVVLSEDVKGAPLAVANMAAMYALAPFKECLLENVTIVTVINAGANIKKRYELIDANDHFLGVFNPTAWKLIQDQDITTASNVKFGGLELTGTGGLNVTRSGYVPAAPLTGTADQYPFFTAANLLQLKLKNIAGNFKQYNFQASSKSESEVTDTTYIYYLPHINEPLDFAMFKGIAENAYGTHPAFNDLPSFCIWILQNGGGVSQPPESNTYMESGYADDDYVE